MKNNLVLSVLFILVINLSGFAQTYEIKFDVDNASGWYGGDDRPNSQLIDRISKTENSHQIHFQNKRRQK